MEIEKQQISILNIFSEPVSSFQTSSALLDLVIYSGTVFFVLIVILFGFIFFKRLKSEYDGAREKKFNEKWTIIIFKWLDNELIEQPSLSYHDQILLMKLWLSLRQLLEGETAYRLNDFAYFANFKETIKNILLYRTRDMEKKEIWLQILAIRVAKKMQDNNLCEMLAIAAESSNIQVNLEATSALLDMNYNNAEIHVISTLLKFKEWAPYIVNKLSIEGGSKILHLVGEYLDYLPQEQARNLFSLINLTDDKTLVPVIINRLNTSDDAEEKAIAIKSLARIGGKIYKNKIMQYAVSDEFFLRLSVAIASRQIGDSRDLPLLEKLLSDSVWWVRYRAAQAILAILDNSDIEIKKLLARIKDPFAKDMIMHVHCELSL